jgi:hypothetical protein
MKDIRATAIEAAEDLDYRVETNEAGNMRLSFDADETPCTGWFPPEVIIALCANAGEAMVRGVPSASWVNDVMLGMSGPEATDRELGPGWRDRKPSEL